MLDTHTSESFYDAGCADDAVYVPCLHGYILQAGSMHRSCSASISRLPRRTTAPQAALQKRNEMERPQGPPRVAGTLPSGAAIAGYTYATQMRMRRPQRAPPQRIQSVSLCGLRCGRHNRIILSGAAREREALCSQHRFLTSWHDARRRFRHSVRARSPAGPTDRPISLPEAAARDASTGEKRRLISVLTVEFCFWRILRRTGAPMPA
jgi:hypothetical protein